MSIIPRILVLHPLRYAALVVDTPLPSQSDGAIQAAILATAETRDVADYFCFVRSARARRILEDVHQLSSDRLADIAAGKNIPQELLLPHPVPPEVEVLLPPSDQAPVFNLPSRIARLWLGFGQIALLEELVTKLGASTYSSDKELAARYKQRIDEILTIARMEAQQELVELREVLPIAADEPAFNLLMSFLARVSEADGSSKVLGADVGLPDLYQATQRLLDLYVASSGPVMRPCHC